MNRYIKTQQIIACFPMCLLVLIGLTLFASPVAAQVFDSGPSYPGLFDTVINVPPAPDIDLNGIVGGDGSSTQLNVSDGGLVGMGFQANSDSEVNIRGGDVGSAFKANDGSEVNITGGDVGSFFDANDGSEVNITGGSVGVGFHAGSGSKVKITGGVVGPSFSADSGSVVNISGGLFGNDFLGRSEFLAASGSEVNLVGNSFFLDGVRLSDSLTNDEAFTIVDRDVTLSGRLADGTAFSFNLNPNPPVFEPDGDYFDPGATLTVREILLGDGNQDGIVTFLDIDWFIGELASGSYLAEADINQDGDVNFLDIAPFIELLSGN